MTRVTKYLIFVAATGILVAAAACRAEDPPAPATTNDAVPAAVTKAPPPAALARTGRCDHCAGHYVELAGNPARGRPNGSGHSRRPVGAH